MKRLDVSYTNGDGAQFHVPDSFALEVDAEAGGAIWKRPEDDPTTFEHSPGSWTPGYDAERIRALRLDLAHVRAFAIYQISAERGSDGS